MEPSIQQKSPAVPIAIIVGFAMIALAIFFTNKNEPVPSQVTQQTDSTQRQPAATSVVPPINERDYVRGNPNAPIVMIEYSDYECPFCKEYHSVMSQIMDEYGVTGKIAWVYRQFPLAQLHPNATKLSEAGLCVGEIAGNTAFWNFTDLIFNSRDIDAPTNITKLPQYVAEVGVDQTAYVECINSGRMEASVLASAEEGFRIGARGTPYTILMVGDQEAVIDGAKPYEVVKAIVQNLIDQLDGTYDSTVVPTPPTPPAS